MLYYSTILYYSILLYTIYIYIYYTTLHYTTLPYTTLPYTTLHYTTLHYTAGWVLLQCGLAGLFSRTGACFQDSSKGGAVETGCIGLHYIIGGFII